MRSLRGKAPADGRPLRCGAHRHGRARRPFQTFPAQPWRLDRVQSLRTSVPTDAPLRGPASPFREAWITGPAGVDPRRVCPRQTARELPHGPAPYEAGDHEAAHGQARASATLRAVSGELSFPLRPQRCGARAYGEKTADRTAHVGALAGVSSGACRQRCDRALRNRLRRGVR